MRSLVLFSMVVAGLSLAPSPVRAQCPSNATRASLAVWPAESIQTGKTVTGTHPCGKRIQCTGGRPGDLKTRSCRWL
jgi:hypothetical protein